MSCSPGPTGLLASLASYRLVCISLAIGPAQWLGACAPSATPFERAFSAAERASEADRHVRAAAAYERARRQAKRSVDAQEAAYRRARALWKAGKLDAAEAALRRLAGPPHGARSARAAFDLAELAEQRRGPAAARPLRDAALRAHATSGAARGALRRQLITVEEEAGPKAAVRYLESLISAVIGTELEEDARYQRARLLQRLERHAAAVAAYLDVARRFPYPEGPHWDDALFRAARIERRRGRSPRAVKLLRRLLREQEHTTSPGSYQRGRYAEAALELGRILRDDLQHHDAAVEAFERVAEAHETSRLVDDALWEAARTHQRRGARSAACQALKRLLRHAPRSRHAACARVLCSSQRSPRAAAASRSSCEKQLALPPGAHAAADVGAAR